MANRRRTLENILAECVENGGCLEWTKGCYASGYPKFKVKSPFSEVLYSRGNRLVLALSLGRDLERAEIAMHSCDNPKCLNPAHLHVGSIADNNRDTVSKCRRGVRKLTQDDRIKIIDLHASGRHTRSELASMFGTTSTTIGDLVTGRRTLKGVK